MTIDQFLNKYQLNNCKNLTSDQIASFCTVLDYFYCVSTKQQLIQLVTDFYDNADDIYNSIQEQLKQIKQK